MSPPSVDDAQISEALADMNRRPHDPRKCPFAYGSGMDEAWRRGYIDDKGNPVK